MTLLEPTAKECEWDRILRAMREDSSVLEERPEKIPDFVPVYCRPTVVVGRRQRPRRRIAWSRILLPILFLSCIAAYRASTNMETQYQTDLKTVYGIGAR